MKNKEELSSAYTERIKGTFEGWGDNICDNLDAEFCQSMDDIQSQTKIFPMPVKMGMKPAGAMILMEYNLFNISVNFSKTFKEITHKNGTIQLLAGAYGLPTMSDKDVLYYVGSHIRHAINCNQVPSQWVSFTVADFYKFMGKKIGGKDRQAFYYSIVRLFTSYLLTNFESAGKRYKEPFRIIEDFKVMKSTKNKKGIIEIAIKVSDWLMGIYISGNMLTVPREYFKIKPSLKPIYEHVRKHCGQQSKYNILIPNLNIKIGTGHINPKYLKADINKVIKSNKGALLNYKLKLERDKLIVYPHNSKGVNAEITDIVKTAIPGYKSRSTAKKQHKLKAIKEADEHYKKAIAHGRTKEEAERLRYARIRCIID